METTLYFIGGPFDCKKLDCAHDRMPNVIYLVEGNNTLYFSWPTARRNGVFKGAYHRILGSVRSSGRTGIYEWGQ